MKITLNKKLVLLLLVSCSLLTANAQIQFGVKGGVNFSNVSVSGDNSGSSYGTQTGIHVGALVSIPAFSSFTVQPEIVYSTQGSKITNSGQSGNYDFGYINVPVLLKYNTSVGFYAETGPQLSFLMSAKASGGGTSVDIKSETSSTDFGWAFGIGYLLPVNLGIDARYNLGLSNLAKDSGGSGSIKNGVIQIGVFYLFGEGPKK